MSELDEDSDGFLQPHVWFFTILNSNVLYLIAFLPCAVIIFV